MTITEAYFSAAEYKGTECKYVEPYGTDFELAVGGGEQSFAFTSSARVSSSSGRQWQLHLHMNRLPPKSTAKEQLLLQFGSLIRSTRASLPVPGWLRIIFIISNECYNYAIHQRHGTQQKVELAQVVQAGNHPRPTAPVAVHATVLRSSKQVNNVVFPGQ